MINLLDGFSKEDLKRMSEIDAESRNLPKKNKKQKKFLNSYNLANEKKKKAYIEV